MVIFLYSVIACNLEIISNIGAISIEQLLSVYGEMPSGPWAWLGSKLDSRFSIPLTLNEVKGT